MTAVRTPAIGAPLDRIDGPEKVTGAARYAFEQPVDSPAYLYPLEATIAAGRITGIHTADASAEPGVLAVLTHENAPRLASTDDSELTILQSNAVAFRGQFVGGVIAQTAEIARHAASLARFDYQQRALDLELWSDHTDHYAPEHLNAAFETDTPQGDVDAALAAASLTLDATYATPMEHHNPMEPHHTVAVWIDDELTVYCGSQGVHTVRKAVA